MQSRIHFWQRFFDGGQESIMNQYGTHQRVAVSILSGLLAVIALLALSAGVAFAQDQPDGSIIVSPQDADGVWGPGTITATSDVVIEAGVAITIAPGTTIRVADGVGFTVYGGLRSDGPVTFTASSGTPGAWNGIFYADGSSGYLTGALLEYAQHAVTLDTPNPITLADGSLRYNSHAPGADQLAYGAGLAILRGDHLIQNLRVYGNTATASGSGQVRGAGIYIAGGSPTIQGTWVYENTASGNRLGAGGGIGILSGDAVIANSRVFSNTLTGGGNVQLKSGAGIGLAGHTDVIIRESWIAGNRNVLSDGYAGGGGIGFANESSAALIASNVIYANHVQAADWCEGSGIDLWDTSNAAVIHNNLIISNTSGACRDNHGAYGGGINMNGNGTGTYLINNTLVGNRGGRGGGVYMQAGNIWAMNNVVYNNFATYQGGGIRSAAGMADYNDVYGNTSPLGAEIHGDVGPNNIYLDPLFLGAGDMVDYYHLRPDSPAQDSATASATGLPDVDYDGDPRPTNGGWDIGFDEITPWLVVTKRANTEAVQAGAELTYTIAVANHGHGDVTGLTISDTLPAYITWADNLRLEPPTVVGSLGIPPILASGITLTKGAVMTLTFEVSIDAALPAGVEAITNTASITCYQGTAFGATAGTSTAVAAAPDLTLAKSDGAVSAVPGGAVVYTLDYANNGNQDATGVAITETVPAHTTFDAAGGSPGWSCADGSPAGTLCSFTVGDLAAGDAGSVDFGARVVDPLPAGVEQLSNSASIADDGANGADLDPVDNTDGDTTPVEAAPDLALAKSDGDVSTVPGGAVVYALDYANNGSQDATGVLITETVPAHTTFDATGSSPGWICADGSPAGTLCTFTVGDLAAGDAGSVDFGVRVVDTLPVGLEQLNNNAAIADDEANGADLDPEDNTDGDTTPVEAAPDLSLAKSDGDVSTVPDGVVVYTLDYLNNGSQDATGVAITETVPAHTTFDAGGGSPGWSCSDGSPAGTLCAFTVGSLAAGDAGSVDFGVRVVDPLPVGVDRIDNVANIEDDGANGEDVEPGDNTASDATPIVGAAPDLSLTKSDGDATAVVGGEIIYTLDYANAGNQASSGVAITETVPAHTHFDAADSSPGWSCADGSPASTLCSLTVGDVQAGAGGSASFAVTVDDPLGGGVQAISNTAQIGDDGANGDDLNPQNNQDDETTPLGFAAVLSIVKRGPATAQVGDVLEFSFSVQHAVGSDGSPVSEVAVIDDVAGAAALTAGDDGDGLLEAGEIWLFGASYTVQSTDPTPLINTGTVTGRDQAGNPVQASDTHSTALGGYAPVLTLIVAGPEAADVGESLVFTFTLQHGSGSDGTPVSEITMTDTLVGAPALVSGDDGDGLLEAGEAWVFTGAYTVQSSDINPLVSTCSAQGQDPAGEQVTAQNTYTVNIRQPAPETYQLFLPVVVNRHPGP
jgi:uncharacterized repeat protein (TIGR01451 family)